MYKFNFNHLFYFLTIAREGSIVGASKALNMTQPALSHQLKQLESDLGKRLFDRVGRRLELNEDGQLALDHAIKIFRQSEEMMASLEGERAEAMKIVKVGIQPWIPVRLVYEIIRPILFTPRFQAQVFQMETEALLTAVENESLDLALTDSAYSDSYGGLTARLVQSEPLVCVAGDKTGFKGRFPGNLKGKKIVSYPEGCAVRDLVDKFLAERGLDVEIIGAFTDVNLMKTAVESGAAAAFLTRKEAKQAVEVEGFHKLGLLKGNECSFYVITRKGLSEDGLVASLLARRKKQTK